MNFTVYIERDAQEGGYIVSCPAIKGCHSQGETMEEALANIREAITGCLKTLNTRAKHEPAIHSTFSSKIAACPHSHRLGKGR